MGPDSFRIVPSKIPPTWDTELAHHLVAERSHRQTSLINMRDFLNLDKQVDDRLCINPRNRRASDMVDADDVFSQCVDNPLCFRLEQIAPSRIMWHNLE